jgi:AhpD family alkylhydroperoxidase
MLFDLNAYQAELAKSIPDFAKLCPPPTPKTPFSAKKTRQLISIVVAVTTRCDGCITFHTDSALKAGATKQEIAEALGVAMAMNAGAALIYALRALDSVARPTPTNPNDQRPARSGPIIEALAFMAASSFAGHANLRNL